MDTVRPSVVQVLTSGTAQARSLGGLGFIVDPSGYILTSNHIVSGAHAIEVALTDGRLLPVTLIGRNPANDVAVLRVDATGLPAIVLGESAAVRLGQPVMAISRPLGPDPAPMVAAVSATGSPAGASLATDAPLGPDSSGGPLINARGEAIGIVSGSASPARGVRTAGGAIPIDLAKPILRDLKSVDRAPPGPFAPPQGASER